MKKSVLIFALFVILIFPNIRAQNSGDNKLDQIKFNEAFKKVVQASGNIFSGITLKTTVQTELGTAYNVNVDFPGANLVTYISTEDNDGDIDYITVFYFHDNDMTEAEIHYNFVKTCLLSIKKDTLLGTWEINETFSEDKKNAKITMLNSYYPDLYVTLSATFGETVQDIQLIFDKVVWDDY